MKTYDTNLLQEDKIGYLLYVHDPIVAAVAKSLAFLSHEIKFDDFPVPGRGGAYCVIERYLAEEIGIPGKTNIAMNYDGAATNTFYKLRARTAEELCRTTATRTYSIQETFDATVKCLRDPQNKKLVDDLCRLFNIYVPCAKWHEEHSNIATLKMAGHTRHIAELCRIALGVRPAVYLRFPFEKPHPDCMSIKDLASGITGENSHIIEFGPDTQMRMMFYQQAFECGAIIVPLSDNGLFSVAGVTTKNVIDDLLRLHTHCFSAAEITSSGYQCYCAEDVGNDPFFEEQYQMAAKSMEIDGTSIGGDSLDYSSYSKREKVFILEWYLLTHPLNFWAYVNLAYALIADGWSAIAECIIQSIYINSVVSIEHKHEILGTLFPQQINERFVLRIPYDLQQIIKNGKFIHPEMGGAAPISECDIRWAKQDAWEMPKYTPRS